MRRNTFGNFAGSYGVETVGGGQSGITPHEALAIAIVARAVKDYDMALSPLPPSVKYKKVRREKYNERKRLEAFFAGDWYKTLTALDPSCFMRECFVRKRSKVVRRWNKLLLRARKPSRADLEPWQLREIKRKRAGRVKNKTAAARCVTNNGAYDSPA